uniref:Uncharacterized protein n=1 Tax=Micrurus spixii TaxID=129469 RepID=A0A2D4LDG3_9SAUR
MTLISRLNYSWNSRTTCTIISLKLGNGTEFCNSAILRRYYTHDKRYLSFFPRSHLESGEKAKDYFAVTSLMHSRLQSKQKVTAFSPKDGEKGLAQLEARLFLESQP